MISFDISFLPLADQPRLHTLLATLYEKGAVNITLIDTSLVAAPMRYIIVAEADTHVQRKALMHYVLLQMRHQHKEKAYGSEYGWQTQWLLADFVDIVVHIFSPELRLFYNIEKVWQRARIIHFEATPTLH